VIGCACATCRLFAACLSEPAGTVDVWRPEVIAAETWARWESIIDGLIEIAR
jgi:hypothetical protein